ncbi:two-component system sensor histidine kinase NtrB [Luteibacter aegosomatissinici]|uniref:two-component system sensor histidine kinase NtrB n=1 Tax=Luteibacter aegosomatissinici TaxID=2911539 RepID=UPI001FF816D1|nr:PAS domain-containing sensor histidine kinase [Luteibacter aegosomatissinici]UPG93839.1 ATP-binding protein [Luteibacter aegosomatissinici]
MPQTFAQQQQLMDIAQDCVMQLDLAGQITAVNAPGVILLRLPNASAVIGRPWSALWPKEFQQTVADAVAAAATGRTTRFVAATEGADAQRRWWSVSVGPLTKPDASVEAIGTVSREITERVQLEASLDAINTTLRERLAAAQSTIASGVRRETGLRDELAIAERAVTASDRENADLHDRLDLAALAQFAAERVAQQAQKGEAVGQLVAGLSHDFNNNLQTVISALDALVAMDDLTPQQGKFAGFALDAARHASVMSQRLLAFTRVHPYVPSHLDLVAVMADIVPMMAGTLGRGMRLEMDAGAGPLAVFADAHSIQQGLMNLCVNARDACEGNGTIRITFGAEHVDAEQASLVLPEGDYVFAEVADNGPGMPDEVKERLFQPFFTTKPAGQGTGLGMAQVLGLMRQASGSVEVQSQLGEGTRVRLVFPRVVAPAEV